MHSSILFLVGLGREHDDWRIDRSHIGAKLVQYFKTTEVRELEIEQDQSGRSVQSNVYPSSPSVEVMSRSQSSRGAGD